jgi:tetratricopeptide (TPR) repeat protein
MTKWLRFIPAVSVATLVLVLAAGCKPSGPQALLQGQRLIQEGKHDQAMARLKVATERLPKNAQAWNHLGMAYHGTRQLDQALAAYRKARTLDPNLADVRFNLGCLFLDQNKVSEAQSELAAFTIIQPDSPEGWLKLGEAQSHARQFAEAKGSFDRALRLKPKNPEAWNGLGMLELMQNRPREALYNYAQALQQQTNFGPALLNQAVVYHQHLKNPAQALQKYREYLALKPPPPKAPAVQAIVRQLELGLRPPSRPTPTNLGPSLLAISSPPGATRVESTTQKVSLAVTGAAALPAIKTVVSHPKPKPKSEPKPESKHEPRPDLQKAREPVTNLVSRPPATSPPPAVIVQLPEEVPPKPALDVAHPKPSADTNGTAPALASPVASDSAKVVVMPKVAPKSEKRGFLQRLNPVTWIRSKPKPTKPTTPSTRPPGEVVVRTVVASNLPGRPAAPTPLTPQPMPARYPYRSPAKPALGDRREAERYFARGIEDQREGRWAMALEAYKRAIELDPSYFEAHYNLALGSYQAGQLPQALLEYEMALAINPQSFNARYNFALALDKANYPRDAANELEKLLRDAPAETRVHLLLANLFAERLFQPQLARNHYTRVLELDPRHSQAPAIRAWLAAHP